MRLYWLGVAFILSLLMAILHFWAFEDFLYWRYRWFDIPMHLLGGMAIGSFLIGFLMHHRWRMYIAAFVCAVVAWEVMEYFSGFLKEANYAVDTALDLVMGSIGAGITYVIARITTWR